MKAIVFDRIGPPLDVLELRDVPTPEPGSREVLVELLVATVNPGDFFFIEGLYPEPKKPHLPQQIAGTGGAVGRVIRGGGETSIEPGTLVSFAYYGAWAELAVVPEEWLIPLPAGYPLDTAAQLTNVISAVDLLDRAQVRPGQWLALTAGNSTVATLVLQLARAREIKVLSLVRRAQPDLDLRAWGAAEVIELSRLPAGARVADRVAEVTGGAGLHGVIDAVGGPLLGDLVRSLAMGGRAIVYGAFSQEPFTLHSAELLMKASTIETYAYRYFFSPPPKQDAAWLESVIAQAGQDSLRMRIAGRHSLDDFASAVRETIEHGERGKRLLVTR